MSHNHPHDHEHGHDHSHEPHDHEHVHNHDHSCCSPGEEYERFIQEERRRTVSRRNMLKTLTAAGIVVAGGGLGVTRVSASGLELPTNTKTVAYVAAEDDDFLYLSGDHHIHTKYSSDAKYDVQRQVAEANSFGLDWMLITDHGSRDHNKLSVDQTIPDLVRARGVFKNLLIFSGLEVNIPGGEHGTVMMQPNPKELDILKEFEAFYDGAIAPNNEETMLAGLRYLDKVDPKPIFFANHPARRGLDSPHEMRNWKLTAPDVVFGYEGAPGHQAAGLLKDAAGKYIAYRGFYGNKPGGDGAHDNVYGPESYFTYGGYDWMTAKLGGVWDSLLGDGLRWWITCNSDSHTYYWDLQDRDNSEFAKIGYVKEIDKYFERPVYGDFAPGEYSRTYVQTNDRSYAGVMAAMRQGNMFVVTGDLIDRLRFYASARTPGDANFGNVGVLTGGTFVVPAGSDVRFQVRLRVPNSGNGANMRPKLDHFDLIYGQITNAGYLPGNADLTTNPTTKVVATYGSSDWRVSQTAAGTIIEAEYTFRNVQQSFYARLRGTNTDDYGDTPRMDADLRGQTGNALSPWESLWFYSNPLFVQVEGSFGVRSIV